jgi:hypothetical protein
MEELFNVNFSSLQDNESIDISDINKSDEPVVEINKGEEKEKEKTKEELEKEKDLIDLSEIEEDEEDNGEDSEDSDDEDEKEKDKQKPQSKKEGSSPVTPFASLLQEQGLLPNLNLEDLEKSENKVEALVEAFKSELETFKRGFIESFPEELIDMAEAVSKGLPFEQIKDSKIKQINYSSLSESKLSESEDLQKSIINDYLLEKGFKRDKIDKFIEKYEDSGELESEAKEALGELKEIFKEKEENIKKSFIQQQRELEDNNKKIIKDIETKVLSANEIIPGRKISEEIKRKTLDSMLKIVDQTRDGVALNGIMAARSKDPIKFDMNVAYLMNITNNFTDWSKLINSVKTSAVKDFERILSESNNTSHQSGKHSGIKADANILEGLKYIK